MKRIGKASPLTILKSFFKLSYTLFSFLYSLFSRKRSLRLVGPSGLEPPTSRLSGVRSNLLSYEPMLVGVSRSPLSPIPLSGGGDERDRTDDPLLAKQVLSQLSYTPISPLKA